MHDEIVSVELVDGRVEVVKRWWSSGSSHSGDYEWKEIYGCVNGEIALIDQQQPSGLWLLTNALSEPWA